METQLSPSNGRSRPARAPAVDIWENDHEFVIVADVPGASPDSVQVEVDQGALRLGAEGASVRWARSFLVPRGIAVDQIHAELSNGVVRLTLPKSAEVRRRTVEVKAV